MLPELVNLNLRRLGIWIRLEIDYQPWVYISIKVNMHWAKQLSFLNQSWFALPAFILLTNFKIEFSRKFGGSIPNSAFRTWMRPLGLFMLTGRLQILFSFIMLCNTWLNRSPVAMWRLQPRRALIVLHAQIKLWSALITLISEIKVSLHFRRQLSLYLGDLKHL